MKPIYLTPEELADILRVHPETIRKSIRQGKIHAQKVGRLWRIPWSECVRVVGDEASLRQALGREE
ncbi:helix-turn-helix domain-containing protein [Thermus oshimai]